MRVLFWRQPKWLRRRIFRHNKKAIRNGRRCGDVAGNLLENWLVEHRQKLHEDPYYCQALSKARREMEKSLQIVKQNLRVIKTQDLLPNVWDAELDRRANESIRACQLCHTQCLHERGCLAANVLKHGQMLLEEEPDELT